MPSLEKAIGASLKYRQLHRHPKYWDVWNKSYPNELGSLSQGFGNYDAGSNQHVAVTDFFFCIRFKYIPDERIN